MAYRVVVPKKVAKQVKKIDSRYRKKIFLVLSQLQTDPYIGIPLSGNLKGQWKYRIGSYRIIYEVYKNELVVLLIKIDVRGGAYK